MSMKKIYFFSLTEDAFSEVFYGLVHASGVARYEMGQTKIASGDTVICYVSSKENRSAAYIRSICEFDKKGNRMIPIIDDSIAFNGKKNATVNHLDCTMGYIWCRSNIYKRCTISALLNKVKTDTELLDIIIGEDDNVTHKNTVVSNSLIKKDKLASPSITGCVCVLAAVIQLIASILLLPTSIISTMAEMNIISINPDLIPKSKDGSPLEIWAILMGITFHAFVIRAIFYRMDKSSYDWTWLNNTGKKIGRISNAVIIACVVSVLIMFLLDLLLIHLS